MLMITAYTNQRVFIGDDIWFSFFYINRFDRTAKVKVYIHGEYNIKIISFKNDEEFFITDDISIIFSRKNGRKSLQVGIKAPKEMLITRENKNEINKKTFSLPKEEFNFDFYNDKEYESDNNVFYIDNSFKKEKDRQKNDQAFDDWFKSQMYS